MVSANVEVSEELLESNFPNEYQDVEVVLEPEIMEYTTEEDEHLSISKPGKSGAMGGGSISDSSEEGKETQQIKDRSPQQHRRRTKILKADILKKLESSYIPSPAPSNQITPSPEKKLSKKLTFEFKGVPISRKAVK